MDLTIDGGKRTGRVYVPASKSQAHRALIMAALGKSDCVIECKGVSVDISAMANCLSSAGADIKISGDRILVSPIADVQHSRTFECMESGNTLRFLLPIFGALGIEGEFLPKGRLIERPLYPLDAELLRHGMKIDVDKAENKIRISGRLSAGDYELSGGVSSQYISGLLMALPLLEHDSTLTVTGTLQSKGYVKMTEELLTSAGVKLNKCENENVYKIRGSQKPDLGRHFTVEGDYSNAAFFLAMGALSEKGVCVSGLKEASSQGDREILEILRKIGAKVSVNGSEVTVRKGELRGITVDASDITDLVPAICAVASVCEGGSVIKNISRLRLKESDRVMSTCAVINSLGGDGSAISSENEIVIHGKPHLTGGTVDSYNDHRIAMASAVCACSCTGEVTVLGSECVNKTYPAFWDDFSTLQADF